MKVGFDGYFMEDEKTAYGKAQRNLLKWLTIIDVKDEFYVFTNLKEMNLLPSNSKINYIAVERKENNFFARTAAIRKAIQRNNIKLDVYIETVEIPPKLNQSVKIYSLQHDFSNGTLEPTFSLAHLKGIIYRAYQVKAIRMSDVIICNSKYTMDQLLLLHPGKKKVLVSSHGCDSIYEENLEYYAANELTDFILPKKFFLFVGRITVKHKNIPFLLETFELFSKMHKDFSLVIASTEDPSKVERNLMEKLGKRLIFFKGLSTSEIAFLYSKASAFIFPSYYEGFGVPILEAQYMGCPLVLNDIQVFREISGGCAIFFNGQRDDLLRAMEDITDEKIRLKLTECGRINSKKYSWKNVADTIYTQLLLENGYGGNQSHA